MRSIFIFLFLLATSCFAQTSTIDTALIRKTGADQYGMKKYVFVFLKPGPNKNIPKDSLSIIQKGHMDNIGRLAKEGLLVLAGPFMDAGPYRGIFILNVATVEEAEKLTSTDPAIKAGRLSAEFHPWYGSAALMEVNGMHDRLQTKKF